MQTTMNLLDRALEVENIPTWTKKLGLSAQALYNARDRGHLSPAIAGTLAEELGQDPQKWIVIAALESERDSACKTRMLKRAKAILMMYLQNWRRRSAASARCSSGLGPIPLVFSAYTSRTPAAANASSCNRVSCSLVETRAYPINTAAPYPRRSRYNTPRRHAIASQTSTLRDQCQSAPHSGGGALPTERRNSLRRRPARRRSSCNLCWHQCSR